MRCKGRFTKSVFSGSGLWPSKGLSFERPINRLISDRLQTLLYIVAALCRLEWISFRWVHLGCNVPGQQWSLTLGTTTASYLIVNTQYPVQLIGFSQQHKNGLAVPLIIIGRTIWEVHVINCDGQVRCDSRQLTEVLIKRFT